MKKYLFITIKFFLLMVLFTCCNKDDEKKLPSLTTINIREITDTSAFSGGIISNDGNDFIEECGVCWSSSLLEPNISDDKTNDGTGDGEFTSVINGLMPGTTYYVRAYATNSVGTAYGNTVFFNTNEGLPIITTLPISLITHSTAQCGGNITVEGNTLITARGVCWGIESKPDISGNKTIDGTGYGEFVSNITGLMANTTYYVRAYATNSEGATAYGNEQTFITLLDIIEYPMTGSSGLNILSDENTEFTYGKYSISATIPEGVSLKIVIQPRDGSDLNIGVYIMENNGWTYQDNGPTNVTLSVDGNNQTVDIPIDLVENGKLTINYFENSDQITKTKNIDY